MEKILVVDDNRQIADFLAYKVLPKLGYKGSVAYTGNRAIKVLLDRYKQLSLMLLDWELPDMTGLDVLQLMKDKNISLPTIIITGEGSEEVAVDALRLGVEDYLVKPIESDVLGEAIGRALEKSRRRERKAVQTARLKNQLSWMSEISKIGRFITSTLDVNEVLRRVIDSATELVSADQGSLALLESPGEHLYLRALRPSIHAQIQYLRIPVSIPQFDRVLMSQKPVRGVGQEKATLRNLIHLPILIEGKTSGVLSISRQGSSEFTVEEEAKLVALSDYAAIAISNALQFNKANISLHDDSHAVDLQRAIDQNEFILHYQPIVSIDQRDLIGFEALIRWVHPDRGILVPGDFIPAAEDSGLISDIDRWVLHQACQQLYSWQHASISDPDFSVSVNIDADHLTRDVFLENVISVLRDCRIDPSSLKLEIPEKAIVQNPDLTVDLIKELSGLGIQVLVDDFGSGYFSVGQLSNLPLSAIKIDRSFIKGIHGDHQQRQILNAIASLTNRLNVNVVAEGIETQIQLDTLKQMGFSYGQGYLIAKPMETNAVPLWLQSSQA